MLGVWINYITLHGYVLATMGNNNNKDGSGSSYQNIAKCFANVFLALG